MSDDDGIAVATENGRAHFTDRDGNPVTVAVEDAPRALAAGMRPLTTEDVRSRRDQAKYGTALEEAKTFGEGALDTATLGLGTAAATAIGGEDYRQAAADRARINPTARMAGQVVGAVAPSFIPGGQFTPAGLIGEAGGAVERGVGGLFDAYGINEAGAGLVGEMAKRAFALGAGGAAEGAAYGAGGSLADSALEGTDWTAERALHGLKQGALYGLTGGAIAGAGEAVASRVGRKLLDSMLGEGKTLRAAARDYADRKLVGGAVGEDSRVLSALTEGGENPERLGEIADSIRARGATDPGEITKAVTSQIRESADTMKTVAESLDRAGVRPNGQAIFADLEDHAAKLEATGLESDARLAGRLRRELQPLRNKLELPNGELADPTFSQAATVTQRLEKVAGGWLDQNKNAAASTLQDMAGSLSKRLDEAAGQAGEDVGQAWQKARRDLRDFTILKSAMRSPSPAAPNIGANMTGVGSTIASLVLGHTTPAAIATGLISGTAHKFIADRGTQALGWIAQRVAGLERASTDSARALAGLEVPRAVVRAATVHELAGDAADHFDAVRQDITQATSSPSHMIAKVQSAIGPAATEQPEVAQAMGQRIVADYQYLRSLLPAPINNAGATLQPQRDKPIVPKDKQRAVVSAARALANPGNVFRSLATGKVDWAAVDALKARRPELWGDFRAKVALSCAQNNGQIAYSRRVMLGTVFEFPSDPSMLPGVVPAPPPSPPPPSATGAPSPRLTPGNSKPAGEALGTPNSQAIEGQAA